MQCVSFVGRYFFVLYEFLNMKKRKTNVDLEQISVKFEGDQQSKPVYKFYFMWTASNFKA